MLQAGEITVAASEQVGREAMEGEVAGGIVMKAARERRGEVAGKKR